MKQPAILCLVWDNFAPVLERYLAEHGPLTLLTPSAYAGAELAKVAARQNCSLLSLEHLIDPAGKRYLGAQVQKVKRAGSAYFASREWAARTPSGGAGDLAGILTKRLDKDLPGELMLLYALERAAEQYAIKLTLVIEDVSCLTKTSVLWSRGRRIPSLHFLHGVALARPYTVHGQLHADMLAVYGERSLETYVDQGIAPERCRVVGNPAWDALIARRPQRVALRSALCAKYGLDEELPIVTFATTWAANLTAVLSEDLFGTTLSSFLDAVKELRAQGVAVNAVIKDRAISAELGIGRPRVDEIAAELGLTPEDFTYTKEDGGDWVVASDILIGVDSNILVEAMMVGTPALNMLTDALCRLGPSFDADSGVLECEADELAPAVARLLGDAMLREALLAQMQAAAPRYNAGIDGGAAVRLSAVMEELALRTEQAGAGYVWESLLDVEHADASQYHGWAQTHLFELFKHKPRRLLDIGCGAGATGEAAKKAYPDATVFGIEVNRAAAAIAAKRLDHVADGKFEEIDLEAFGIHRASIDTVIVGDVLEHMYDPWHVMVRLRPYLTADAQVIASIPNVRNLVVMAELAKGNWRYEPFGLLDITHIRFFTPRDIRRFFHETGYRVTETRFHLDTRLADFFNRHSHHEVHDVEFDRLVLRNVSRQELGEMCSLQVHLRAEPGADAEQALEQSDGDSGSADYAIWCAARTLQPVETDQWEQRLAQWPKHPRVHLAVTMAGIDEKAISRTLQSAAGQLYHNVALTIVADAPPPQGWRDSDNLRWRHAGADIIEAINKALLDLPADWLGVIDAGDMLAPYALLFMLEAAYAHPDWRLLYSDEDSLRDSSERLRPHFKPDFNLDLLRSYPYVGGLLMVSTECFADLGGFDSSMLGVEDYDLVLRASERAGAAGIGHVAEVLLQRGEAGGHAKLPLADLWQASQASVARHLERAGVKARVEPGILPLSQRLTYVHDASPLVSIILVARAGCERLRRCLEAVLGKNRYANIELLVLDANSPEPELREYVAGLEALGEGRIKAFRLEQDATLAAFHNLLAEQAQGDYLLFLDSDTTPLNEDWLTVLMSHAQRPEVGAVGPRLLTGAGKVRRAGMILGVDGFACSAFTDLAIDDPGYFGRALVDQAVSAIGSGAFLTRRTNFAQLGGFDTTLGVDVAEVDYCLRLTERGLHIIWTPYASLLSEGGTTGVDWSGSGGEVLEQTRLHRLGSDPNYNRHLSLLSSAVFSVEARTVLNWDPLPWKPLPRVLAKPGDNMGCGQYRIFAPLRALTAAGKLQAWADFNAYSPAEIEHLELDTLVFQRQILDGQITPIERHKVCSGALRVFELDDLLIQLPGRSVHHKDVPKDVADRLRRVVPLCDRFIVSTDPLAAAYRGLNDDIRVVPNMLEKSRWEHVRGLRRQSDRARVGWIGGVGHTGDLEMVVDVVCELAAEVDWVFMGMCPDMLRPYVREITGGVPFEQYPKAMAALNLDLAIAPLEINAFNEAKSNLRILEYGVLGLPVICSDIYPYQGDFPVTRVRNRSTDWVAAIREHVSDLDECGRRGDALRQHVLDHWMLEDNLDLWLKAWLR